MTDESKTDTYPYGSTKRQINRSHALLDEAGQLIGKLILIDRKLKAISPSGGIHYLVKPCREWF